MQLPPSMTIEYNWPNVGYPKEWISTIWDYGGIMQNTLKMTNNES